MPDNAAALIPDVGVVLPAGGQGLRAGGPVPKQFLPLGSKLKPMFQYSLETFHKLDFVREIVLVLPPEKLASYQLLTTAFPKLKLASGGIERWASVRNGVNALSAGLGYVAVHDVARPFVSEAVIRRCLEAVDPGTCVIAAVPASDTVKEVEFQKVTRTLDRRRLILVQTPQVFPRELLEALYSGPRHGEVPTDEAMLAEQAGEPVRWVWGSDVNRKVTTTTDLHWAEWMAARLEGGQILPDH